jgi:hypothetical protein
LPPSLRPIGEAIYDCYERAIKNNAEAHKMDLAFTTASFKQIFFVRKYPDRPLEAAAIIFKAVDEVPIGAFGSIAAVMRMQACLELDRIQRSPPAGMDEAALRRLKTGFTTLATCIADFAPAVKHFEDMEKDGIKTADVKLGLALSKTALAYIASQARRCMPELARFIKDDVQPTFGPAFGEALRAGYQKYSATNRKQLDPLTDEARKLFSDYAREQVQGSIYELWSECWWNWFYMKKPECIAKAKEAFALFEQRNRSDVEKTMIRKVVSLWMEATDAIDYSKVKLH